MDEPEASLPRATPARSAYRRDIQGLRGVAVLVVVLYHAGVPFFPAGFVGVDIFFVISGYLITGLLVREVEARNGLNLAHFYARRVRRLLPAALLVIIVVLATAPLFYPPLEQGDIFSASRAAAMYLVNFWFAGRAVDYLGNEAEANPILHMWSLAVEEQFYLVWPLLIAAVVRGPSGHMRLRLTVMVTVISVASFVLCVWITWKAQPWAFFGTLFRTWEFGLGALVYLLADRVQRFAAASLLFAICGAASVLVSILLLSRVSLFPGALALLPAGGTALVIATIHSPSGSKSGSVLSSWLSWWPLAKVGDLSYSWYLWHWPVLVFAALLYPEQDVGITMSAVLLSLTLAYASYRWVENPIRFSSMLAASDYRVIALGVACSVCVAATGTILKNQFVDGALTANQRSYASAKRDIPKVYKAGCHANFDAIDLPECKFGSEGSSKRVVLFGDSHAAHWFPALERLSLERDWRLISLTKSGCPSVDVELLFSPQKRRSYVECEEWRSRTIHRIARERPELVVLANSSRYDSALDWEAGVRRTLQRLSASGTSVVIIRDTPWPGVDGPTCLARMDWWGRDAESECMFQRSEALAPGLAVWNAEMRALSDNPHAIPIDLTDQICPADGCRVAYDGRVHFTDRHHLTAGFAVTLAPALDRLLREWGNRSESPIRRLFVDE